MIKNNGFTLIELLGVIILLALVALISVPAVNNIMNDSRRSGFETSMNNLSKAANNYFAANQAKIDEDLIFDYSNDGKSQFNDELDFGGTSPESGTVTIESSGRVVFTNVSDGRYSANYDSDNTSGIIITDL